MEATNAEIILEFVNSGYVTGEGTPTLNNYNTDKNEIRLPKNLASASVKLDFNLGL